MSGALALAALSLAVRLYLALHRGFVWLARLPGPVALPLQWPRVVAVVPGRNEAVVVGEAVRSLLQQNYPGRFAVVLVDDHSDDGAAAIAERAAAAWIGKADRRTVRGARPLPPASTGKLWAVSEGVRHAEEGGDPPHLLPFADAELVARIEAGRRDLVSLMMLLRCRSWAERLLIPAFFFFAKLYPFGWSNDPRRPTAAAAGACVLLRRSAWCRIGGFAGMQGALIDDCALARAVKASGGSIWIGLATETRSFGPYPGIIDVCAMVRRTAYAQPRNSLPALAASVPGLVVTYLAPPAPAFVDGAAGWLAGAAGLGMTLAYLPIVRFDELSPLWALLLPAVALVYLGATVDSARRHWQDAGGEWKGRVQWRSRS